MVVKYLEIPPNNDNVMDRVILVLFILGLLLLKLENKAFLNVVAFAVLLKLSIVINSKI